MLSFSFACTAPFQDETPNLLTNLLSTIVRSETSEESTSVNLADTGLTVYEYLDEQFTLDGDIGEPMASWSVLNCFNAASKASLFRSAKKGHEEVE